MIEVPRGALMGIHLTYYLIQGEKLAQDAEFFSFGTNDLT